MKYPAAIWTPGPAFKQNGGTNTCRGVVLHSMVGGYQAALGELLNPQRRASWCFSVLKDGSVRQHYETEVQTWHAGSAYNNSTIGIEHEGGLSPYNEPLTPVQLGESVALVRWLSRVHGFPLVRKNGLWEHNEVSDSPTACPSNRIIWPAYAAAPAPVPEEEMKSYLAWCIDLGRVYFVGPNGARYITDQKIADELAKVFGPMNVALSAAAINVIGMAP